MARFDFTDAAATGYGYIWKERTDIASLAAMPFLVKIGSFAAIMFLGLEANILRQGLILLPAYLLEGFIVALVIRMFVFNERFAGLLDSGRVNEAIFPEPQRRSIMAGVIVYVMTKLATSLMAGSMMVAEAVETSPMMPEPNGSVFITSLMILVFMLWAFRFFWLYVPAAMGIPPGVFLERIKGFTTSFYLLALWLMCFVPMMVVLVAAAKLLGVVFPGAEAGDRSPIFIILMAGVQSGVELVVSLVSAVAMAQAIRSVFLGK
ncbi:MAG: hypothetical protein WBK77_07050 [Alphaproteobacteria bacterium]